MAFRMCKLKGSRYRMVCTTNPAPTTVMLDAKISAEEAGTDVFHIRGGTCVILQLWQCLFSLNLVLTLEIRSDISQPRACLLTDISSGLCFLLGFHLLK